MLNVSGIRAVLFDLGGTLFDFQVPESVAHLRAGFGAVYDVLASQGLSLPARPSYLRRAQRSLLNAYIWSRIRGAELDPVAELDTFHRRLGCALSDQQLTDVCQALYGPVRQIASAHPDAPATLAELRRRGYRLGLISNTIAPPPALDDHLAAEGLLEHLPVRIYSCKVGVAKPRRRIFEAALAAVGVSAHEAAYVGDKPRIDVRGARRLGMLSILRVPHHGATPPGPAADLRIREIADLLDVLPSRPTP